MGNSKMMCPTFLFKFLRSFFQKATVIPFTCLLLRNATATATVIRSLWVVTCADETHHFNVKCLAALGRKSKSAYNKAFFFTLRNDLTTSNI